MKYYRRLCNGLTDYGRFIPAETSDYFNLYQHIDKLDTDWYLSIFVYNEKQVEHAQEYIDVDGTMRPRGISGVTDVFTNKLVFDFDSEDDIGASLTDTKEVIRRLTKRYKFPLDSIQIYFSGNKGFSVEVDTNKKLTPPEFKQIVCAIAKDLPTFDSKIVNASRIFRIPYTKHNKSGLYKTPFVSSELDIMTIEEIRNLAKDELEVVFPDSYKRITMPDEVLSLLTKVEEKKVKEVSKKVTDLDSFVLDIDWSKKPKWLSRWKYAIQHGYFPAKSRSYSLMILAATYQKYGFSKDLTTNMLISVAEKQAERTGTEPFSSEEIEKNIVRTVFSIGWQGGIYAEDNFPEELKRYFLELGIKPEKESNGDSGLLNTKELFNGFKDFAENIEKNTIHTGIEALDKLVQLQTQMLIGIIGSPSSGKTSCSLEILRNTSLRGEQSIFFSLDMGSSLVYTKLAQKVTGYQNKQLYKLFVDKNEKEINRIRDRINNDFANMTVSFKTALGMEDIRNGIIEQEQKSGKKVRLVVVDYLECIALPTSDVLTGISQISQQLKDIANDLNVAVILLLQPRKSSGDPSNPIESYIEIKGASTVGQACSVVIGLWREGFSSKTNENDKYISFAVLKNRMGPTGSVDCGWEGVTGQIYDLSETEKEELKELRKYKKDIQKIADL